MRKLRKYWETNKKKILTIIGVLAFIIFIVHFANAMIANNVGQSQNENMLQLQNKENIGSTESIIDDEKISIQTAQENIQIIKQFVTYCNQGNYQSAFNILSDSCQQEVFNSDVNLFNDNYCKKIFKTRKTYSADLWSTIDNIFTYQVKYYDDNLLTTGGTSTSTNIEDYITVIEEKGEKKLNISSFIYYEEINKTVSQKDIEITVNSRKVYRTYEKYNFIVKNTSGNIISISTEKNEEDICLVDTNNVQYISLLYEVPEHLLNIKSGYQSNIDLKFNKVYNVYRKIKKIKFQSIALDYKEHTNSSNEETEKLTIEIPI